MEKKKSFIIMEKTIIFAANIKTVFGYGTENKTPAIGHQRF